jgi:hypothetical protein
LTLSLRRVFDHYYPLFKSAQTASFEGWFSNDSDLKQLSARVSMSSIALTISGGESFLKSLIQIVLIVASGNDYDLSKHVHPDV